MNITDEDIAEAGKHEFIYDDVSINIFNKENGRKKI